MPLTKKQILILGIIIFLYLCVFIIFKFLINYNYIPQNDHIVNEDIIVTFYTTPFDMINIAGIINDSLYYINTQGQIACKSLHIPYQTCKLPAFFNNQVLYINNGITVTQNDSHVSVYKDLAKLKFNVALDKNCIIKNILYMPEQEELAITCLNKKIKNSTDWIHKLYLLKIQNNVVNLNHIFTLKDSYIPFSYDKNNLYLYTDNPIIPSALGYIQRKTNVFLKLSNEYRIFQQGISILNSDISNKVKTLKTIKTNNEYVCYVGISDVLLLGLDNNNWEVINKKKSLTSSSINKTIQYLNMLISNCDMIQIIGYTQYSTTILYNGIIIEISIK